MVFWPDGCMSCYLVTVKPVITFVLLLTPFPLPLPSLSHFHFLSPFISLPPSLSLSPLLPSLLSSMSHSLSLSSHLLHFHGSHHPPRRVS